MTSSSSLKTPLSKARGHGSAKSGAHHWWMQRMTAIALVPLSIWLMVALMGLSTASYVEVVLWLKSSLNTTLLLLFVGVSYYHMMLGMQVIIEDYVSSHGLRTTLIIGLKFAVIFIGLFSALMILRVFFS